MEQQRHIIIYQAYKVERTSSRAVAGFIMTRARPKAWIDARGADPGERRYAGPPVCPATFRKATPSPVERCSDELHFGLEWFGKSKKVTSAAREHHASNYIASGRAGIDGGYLLDADGRSGR